jgi:RimJ/RimL family protein N-acetyltransferase
MAKARTPLVVYHGSLGIGETQIMDGKLRELARSARLVLRSLGERDLDAVTRVYRQSPRFFRTLADIDAPPLEHILGDMREGPPGYGAAKHFLGVCLRESGELVGVADFVVDYPTAGKGCFGLLLLMERHHSAGLGTEAAALVEGWARDAHAVHEVTIGVELVNERACSFWRKCGYEPTGELFETSSLGRTHQAEVLIKRL